jgi:hypothetical protein
MSICATLSGNNLVIDNTEVPPNCPDLTILSDVDYQRLIETPTLQEIFTMPLASDLGAIWLVGYSLPIIIHLTAWGLDYVVKFINQ